MILNYFPFYPVHLDALRLDFVSSFPNRTGWLNERSKGTTLRYLHNHRLEIVRVNVELDGMVLPLSEAETIFKAAQNLKELQTLWQVTYNVHLRLVLSLI